MELKDGVSMFHRFVALHKSQLESAAIPVIFWDVLSKKLHGQILDAGDVFCITKGEGEQAEDQDEGQAVARIVVYSEHGLNSSDPQHVYLIDHAWTYSAHEARNNLRQVPGLAQRMTSLMGLSTESCGLDHMEDLVDAVFNEMWKFNQTYTVGSAADVEDRLPLWYIMDEFGSAIQHSDEPNFRTVPFIYIPDGITYTVLFPVKDVVYGEEVTRDYIEGPKVDSLSRKALLLPWRSSSFLSESFQQEEPPESYFLEGHLTETLPNLESLKLSSTEDRWKFKVYSEYEFINQYLTHPRFEITDDEGSADILWYTNHFKSYKELSELTPEKYVNQFPYEHVVTVKDLLSIVCRRKKLCSEDDDPNTLDTHPLWLPTTYNLSSELVKFVSYYQHRENKGLDNHWICKPFNLARGLDTHVTNNLNYILRLPSTGPKIAQKYVENPVLFNRPEVGNVKFDVRYVVLLKSVLPLKAFAYRKFFLRFANHPFELNDFDDYEKHFTVMNYNESVVFCHMLCHEFVSALEAQYSVKWNDIEEDIFSMLRNMLEAAVYRDPPSGIAHSPQSRALYAADIMLAWRTNENGERVMQPKLLEVNWTPDCQRACLYYPDFYNDIFSLLFLNEVDESSFREL